MVTCQLLFVNCWLFMASCDNHWYVRATWLHDERMKTHAAKITCRECGHMSMAVVIKDVAVVASSQEWAQLLSVHFSQFSMVLQYHAQFMTNSIHRNIKGQVQTLSIGVVSQSFLCIPCDGMQTHQSDTKFTRDENLGSMDKKGRCKILTTLFSKTWNHSNCLRAMTQCQMLSYSRQRAVHIFWTVALHSWHCRKTSQSIPRPSQSICKVFQSILEASPVFCPLSSSWSSPVSSSFVSFRVHCMLIWFCFVRSD